MAKSDRRREAFQPAVSPSQMRRHSRRSPQHRARCARTDAPAVFAQPVGSVFPLQLRFPWLRMMRLESTCLHLELVTGRTVIVPLIWASCGVIGERLRLVRPLCGRRVCVLYYVGPRLACRHCNSLWYAAQRTSSTARKFLTKRKIRRKLGDYGQISSAYAPTEAARDVAKDLCAASCGAGSRRTKVGLLI